MASDDLSQTLLGLAAWLSQIRAGRHEWTPEGMDEFEAVLDRAAVNAIALEYKLEAALGHRPSGVEVLAAIRAGRVAVLPTGLALATIYGGRHLVPEVPFG